LLLSAGGGVVVFPRRLVPSRPGRGSGVQTRFSFAAPGFAQVGICRSAGRPPPGIRLLPARCSDGRGLSLVAAGGCGGRRAPRSLVATPLPGASAGATHAGTALTSTRSVLRCCRWWLLLGGDGADRHPLPQVVAGVVVGAVHDAGALREPNPWCSAAARRAAARGSSR